MCLNIILTTSDCTVNLAFSLFMSKLSISPFFSTRQQPYYKIRQNSDRIQILQTVWKEIRNGTEKVQRNSVLPVGFNLPTFRTTCQIHSLLILQGGSVFSSPSVLFFYYQELQGASARRAEGHRGVTPWMYEHAGMERLNVCGCMRQEEMLSVSQQWMCVYVLMCLCVE